MTSSLRSEGQLKIRGQKVSLLEVEAQLTRTPYVNQAVVVAVRCSCGYCRICSGETVLCAFVTPSTIDKYEVRACAKRWLTDAQMPAIITRLRVVPTTPSGKVDRQTLATRASNQYAASLSGATMASDPAMLPRMGLEQRVAAVWAAVLGLPVILRCTRFGEAGGDSLSAVRVVRMLAQECDGGGGGGSSSSSRHGVAAAQQAHHRFAGSYPGGEQTLAEYAASLAPCDGGGGGEGNVDADGGDGGGGVGSTTRLDGSRLLRGTAAGAERGRQAITTVTMLPEHRDACLEMFLRTFSATEPLLVHLQVTPEELGLVVSPMADVIAAGGLSVVALDAAGRVVGCSWNLPLEAHNEEGTGGDEAGGELPGHIGFALGLLEQLEREYCTSDAAASDVAKGNVLNLFASTVDLDLVGDGLALVERMEAASMALAEENGFLRAFTICTNATTEYLALERSGFAERAAVDVTEWSPPGHVGPSPFSDLPPPHRAVVCEKIFEQPARC